MKDEALRLAIKSMKSFQEGTNGLYEGEFHEEIAVCEAALAQPPLPVQRQPLTDEQLNKLWLENSDEDYGYARAIEAAHGIGVKP